MSQQMICDWIEQEYDRWGKSTISSRKDAHEIERSQYIAQLFALHILEKSASKTSDKSEVKK